MITGAQLILHTLGESSSLTSSGAVQKSGTGSPSKSHDGGRGFDVIPWTGRYYFEEVGAFVAASDDAGGGFIYKDANGDWQGGAS